MIWFWVKTAILWSLIVLGIVETDAIIRAGLSGTWQIIIDFNSAHEGIFETILIPLITIGGIILLIEHLIQIKKKFDL